MKATESEVKCNIRDLNITPTRTEFMFSLQRLQREIVKQVAADGADLGDKESDTASLQDLNDPQTPCIK